MLITYVMRAATSNTAPRQQYSTVYYVELFILCFGYHQYKYFMVRDVNENRIKFVYGEYKQKFFKPIK